MSRIVPQGVMTADELMKCSYDLLAILQLARTAAEASEGGAMDVNDVAALSRALALAMELHAPLHDALETHEGVK